jgi:hypothetical protein
VCVTVGNCCTWVLRLLLLRIAKVDLRGPVFSVASTYWCGPARVSSIYGRELLLCASCHGTNMWILFLAKEEGIPSNLCHKVNTIEGVQRKPDVILCYVIVCTIMFTCVM